MTTDEQHARELAEKIALIPMADLFEDEIESIAALLLPLVQDAQRLTKLESLLKAGSVAMSSVGGCKIINGVGMVEGLTLRAAIDRARGGT